MYTFLYFRSGVYHTAKRITEKTKTPVWVYQFEQRPPFTSLALPYAYPQTTQAEAEYLGVYHGSEIAYMLGEVQGLVDASERDRKLSDYMLES